MRDVGGHATSFGTRVRRGQLFRWLGESEADVADPRRMGLGSVVDTAALPGGCLPGLGWVARSFYELPLAEPMPASPCGDDFMQVELGVALESTDSIAELLAILTDPSAYPAAIGCSAGPDSTGIVITLLLSWLGVPDSMIVVTPACANARVGASPLSLLRGVRQQFGSVDGYAHSLGLATALGYLRAALLVESSVARSA
ncbi:MAG: tyrosine-protein phosphatase [Acidimicrobiia bacterium]